MKNNIKLFAQLLITLTSLQFFSPQLLALSADETELPRGHAKIRGKLRVLVSDDLKGHNSERFYVVDEAATKKTFKIRFNDRATPGLATGDEVEVLGKINSNQNELSVSNDDGTSATLITKGTAAATTGNMSTLVLMFNFRDAQLGCSATQTNDLMFTDPSGYSVDALYREMSFGKVTLSGKAVDGVTINASAGDVCDYQSWSNLAEQEASRLGISTSGYSKKIYVFPFASCGWAGLATVGGNSAWVNGYCNLHDVYAHEFGHLLGLNHASSGSDHYGDYSDIMGISGVGLRGVNAPHKIFMGWTPSTSVATTSNGNYNLNALQSNPALTTGPTVLKIPNTNANSTLYLSYRRAVGLDSSIGGYGERLNIHTTSGSFTSFLGSIGENEVFSDATNGVTIKVNSKSDAAMNVTVQSTCAANAPEAYIYASTGTAGAAPGGTINYTMNITNRDSANCAQSQFNFAAYLPAGFTGTLSKTSALLAPGAYTTLSFAVKSGAGTATGTYPIGVSISDAASAAHSLTPTTNYIVDSEAPTAPTNVTATVGRGKQISVQWSASTDNVGVTKYIIYRNGVRAGESSYGSYTDSVGAGTFTYKVIAQDGAGNLSISSNTATVTKARGK